VLGGLTPPCWQLIPPNWPAQPALVRAYLRPGFGGWVVGGLRL
jgi:hypothetical protein